MCYGFLNQLQVLDENFDRIVQLEKEIEFLTQELSLRKPLNENDINKLQNTPGGL